MKNKLKCFFRFQLILISSVAFLSCQCPDAFITASAHSGRTDSSGGHHDNKNKSGLGNYHYHHGYSAHLHTNGVCPYDIPQSAADTSISSPPQDSGITTNTNSGISNTTTSVSAVNYAHVFDATFYAAANPDVAALYGTDATMLFQHFLVAGMSEGRQGNASFNVHTYKAANPQLVALFGENLPQYYLYYCISNA